MIKKCPVILDVQMIFLATSDQSDEVLAHFNNSWIIHISNSMHIALVGYKQDLWIKEYTPKNFLG